MDAISVVLIGASSSETLITRKLLRELSVTEKLSIDRVANETRVDPATVTLIVTGTLFALTHVADVAIRLRDKLKKFTAVKIDKDGIPTITVEDIPTLRGKILITGPKGHVELVEAADLPSVVEALGNLMK